MFQAIMGLILIVLSFIIFILWIAAILSSDGRCHLDNCDECPYQCDPEFRKRMKPKLSNESDTDE